MNKKKEIIFECDKCGKEPDVDNYRSRSGWIVFKTSQGCSCGGKYKLKNKKHV
jgi:hypothetical protein